MVFHLLNPTNTIKYTMEVAALVLGVFPLAELLARLIPKTVNILREYRHADNMVEERLLEFQDHTQKLQLELEEFRSLSPELPEDIQQHIGRLFVILRGKLSAFEVELDDFSGRKRSLGFKVIVSAVEKIVIEIKKWQQRVEDYFEILKRWPKPFKDPRAATDATAIGRVRLVNEAIFAATESTLQSLNLSDVPLPLDLRSLDHSSIQVSGGPDTLLRLFEVRDVSADIDDDKLKVIKKDVMDLTRVLSADDAPDRGILPCRGYRYVDTPRREFILEFQAPQRMRKPRSLRAMLLDKDFKGQILHPLNERLDLAKQLARAVLHVHSKNHVHKNIRPETIVLFETPPGHGNPKAFPVSLGTAFLVGFERVRKQEADTMPIDGTDWSEDLYRHPSRQGVAYSEDKFNMLHDIYSLGVCLLEVGLWRSFVELDPAGHRINNTRACNLMESQAVGGLARRLLSPKRIQDKFIREARTRVPNALGERFSRVVVRCLKCVETFATESENDPFIGLKYV